MKALALAALILISCCRSTPGSGSSAGVRVDQVAYPASGPKVAVVASGKPLKTFSVHRVRDDARVFVGRLSEPVPSVQSGETVQLADFSRVSEAGQYVVRVAGAGESVPFNIARNAYGGLLRSAMRSYYGQRCGIAVDLGWGFAHPACHLVSAFHESSGRTGVARATGGWHDAGDYGRYVVNSGISTGTLLLAFEMYPESLQRIDLEIPESGNAMPDVLDEVRWNLEWMLSMQDSDGGVWQKQTSEKFPGFVRPEADDSTSYVIGTGQEPYKSSCATADFSAVMAIAARVYRPYDAAFADRSVTASKNAWSWMQAHPNVSFKNPPGLSTGEYGDSDCSDERLWAAVELWRTTGDAGAHRYFDANSSQAIAAIKVDAPPDWAHVGSLAAWSYALDGRGEAGTLAKIRAQSKSAADAIVARAAADAYRIPMVRANYVWGSNGVAANYALQLLVADAFEHDQRYVDSAADIVHYLLGRNAVSTSFVTGAGARPAMHPHHRPSGSDGVEAPWPGLLVGGPNARRQDPAQWRLAPGTPPARMYIDAQSSFATNETCINWNAPLVFVLAGLQGR